MKRLARELVSQMPELSYKRSEELSLANAELNLPFIHQTVSDLPAQASSDASDTAIVVAAGPSLHLTNPVPKIVASGFNGTVICADAALGHCLRNGLVPDYVVTVDPHRTRIVRVFGDPTFVSVDGDDYFRRQDLDPYLGTNELSHNQDLITLVNHHGHEMKAIIAPSASQSVTQRCLEAQMELYWWNPLYDDFDQPDSMTRRLFNSNKVPCMVSGGNSGSSAWVFAQAVLGKQHVALVGVDFSYAPGTPLEKTQSYKELMDLFGDDYADAYISVHNPYLKETWYTDPSYYWYRQTFLQMAKLADCTTYNCSEGSILTGKGVRFLPLQDFLSVHA